MADISSKLSEITKNEERERENQKKLLEVSQRINSLKKKIHENEIQIAISEKQRISLMQECNNLKIQSDLQQRMLDSLKSNLSKQLKLLQKQKDEREMIQENAWEKMKVFYNKVLSKNQDTTEKEMLEIKDFIKMRLAIHENQQIENENVALEGEIYGLNLFKQFQEKQMKHVKEHLMLLQQSLRKVSDL